jgi:hypothetical protein
VNVVVSGKKTGPTAVASAETNREIRFSLGGVNNRGKPPTGGNTGGGGVTTPAAPPSFEPTPATPTARRTFSRSATGFAVGPELLLTSADAVKGAKRVMIELPGAQPLEATVERTGDEGLALLRVKGQTFAYVNLATQFAGGPIKCPAYPEVSVFGVTLETIQGRALAAKDDGWQISLGRHPRLPGAPLIDALNGSLVGIELGDRDDLQERLPALSFGKIKAFLADDAPPQPCINPQSAAVVQITASFER